MVRDSSSETDLVISCSLAELCALASLLGGELLIGVPDPFAGWLTEEIRDAVQTAHRTLAERQYLRLQGDLVLMDVAVAAMTGAVVEPQVAYLITSTIPGQPPRQANFYYRPPLTVSLQITADQVILRALSTPDAILEHCVELWEIADQQPAPVTPFSIPESILRSAGETLPGREDMSRQFQESGIPPAEAAALAATLAAPCRNGTLVVVRRRGETWDVDGIAMLEGENGLWLLRPFIRQQARWVECIPCSAEKLRHEVKRRLCLYLLQEEG